MNMVDVESFSEGETLASVAAHGHALPTTNPRRGIQRTADEPFCVRRSNNLPVIDAPIRYTAFLPFLIYETSSKFINKPQGS